MEKNFEEAIQAQRKTKRIMMLLLMAGGLGAVFIFEMLSGSYPYENEVRRSASMLLTNVNWLDVFVEALIVVLMTGSSWHWRGEQRDDLYTEVIGKSTFALKHFQDRIGEEIERRERDGS